MNLANPFRRKANKKSAVRIRHIQRSPSPPSFSSPDVVEISESALLRTPQTIAVDALKPPSPRVDLDFSHPEPWFPHDILSTKDGEQKLSSVMTGVVEIHHVGHGASSLQSRAEEAQSSESARYQEV